MNWIVLIIIITIAVASAIAQAVKNQQEKDDAPPTRRRPTAREGEGVKTGNSDMDRFLQEIEKLRKKSADGGDERSKPAAKPTRAASVPTVAAKKSKRDVPTVATKSRVERLPPAQVISEPPPVPAPPVAQSQPTTMPSPPPSPILSQRGVTQKAQTPFGANLAALLKGKNNIAMAVTLNEIFGPPKSKQ
jgi:hypothetical protein